MALSIYLPFLCKAIIFYSCGAIWKFYKNKYICYIYPSCLKISNGGLFSAERLLSNPITTVNTQIETNTTITGSSEGVNEVSKV